MEQFFAEYLDRLTILHNLYIESFRGLPQEALDWVPGQDMNSLVVLAVHVTGSERFWIGTVALNDPAPRDRDAEFRAKGLSEAELIALFAANQSYMAAAFEQVSVADFGLKRRSPRHTEDFTVSSALLHAMEHTGVHLGHAQITRQLWDQRQG
jgi:uncharacterized damage-inducible protein DinB